MFISIHQILGFTLRKKPPYIWAARVQAKIVTQKILSFFFHKNLWWLLIMAMPKLDPIFRLRFSGRPRLAGLCPFLHPHRHMIHGIHPVVHQSLSMKNFLHLAPIVPLQNSQVEFHFLGRNSREFRSKKVPRKRVVTPPVSSHCRRPEIQIPPRNRFKKIFHQRSTCRVTVLERTLFLLL